MIVWPTRYINPQHPLLEGHLNFISLSLSLSLSIALIFSLSLFTAPLYHITCFYEINSVPILPLSESLTSVGQHYHHAALPLFFWTQITLLSSLDTLTTKPSRPIVTLELHDSSWPPHSLVLTSSRALSHDSTDPCVLSTPHVLSLSYNLATRQSRRKKNLPPEVVLNASKPTVTSQVPPPPSQRSSDLLDSSDDYIPLTKHTCSSTTEMSTS